MNQEETASFSIDRWEHSYQILTPWGESAKSFQVGAGGVTAITVSFGAVIINAERSGRRHVLVFAAGGYGHRAAGLPCEVCGKVFTDETELGAHRRSHRPNHKGSEDK